MRIRGTIEPRPKSGRPSKLTATDIHAIDDAMEGDDETTGIQCLCSIETECPHTVYRARKKLGWTLRGTAYCQLIRAPNRARENVGSSFEHVIWSDETTVQLETRRWFYCRKKGQKPRYKTPPKASCKSTCVGRDKLPRTNKSVRVSRHHGC